MPIETNRLKLPLPLGNESVSRVGINNIFEKIDEGVATREEVEELRQSVSEIDIPDASLTEKGKVQLSNKINGNREDVAATEKAVSIALLNIASDYIRQPGFANTTGTGSAYMVTLNPAPAEIDNGFGITIVPHITNGARPTLNINGLGAVPIKMQDGTPYSAGDLIAGKPYTFRRVGSDFLEDNGGREVINGTSRTTAKFNDDITKGTVVAYTDYLRDVGSISLPLSTSKLDISPDGKKLVTHAANRLYVHTINSDGTLTRTQNITISSDSSIMSVSLYGDYMVLGTSDTPSLSIYKWSTGTNTYSKIANPAIVPSSWSSYVQFSPDGKFLFVSDISSSPVYMYSRSGDAFTKLGNVSGIPTDNVQIIFTPNMKYVFFKSTVNYLSVFKISGTTLTKLTDISLKFLYTGNFAVVTPDSKYIIFPFVNTERLGPVIVRINSDDTFTIVDHVFDKGSKPIGSIGSGTIWSSDISPDGKKLVFTESGISNLIFLNYGDDNLFHVAPGNMPPTTGAVNIYSAKYALNGRLYVLYNVSGTSYISYFDHVNLDRTAVKLKDFTSVPAGATGIGYALESGSAGETKQIMKLL
ncbi:tail fiber protein [Paenibacillus sp. TC-CSREp1]|uniref:tail fiber protein n=1 Tax=Paenibacillus sp. TC-CSREp1 TaxID=3410089 RepID=UPI003CEF1F5A